MCILQLPLPALPLPATPCIPHLTFTFHTPHTHSCAGAVGRQSQAPGSRTVLSGCTRGGHCRDTFACLPFPPHPQRLLSPHVCLVMTTRSPLPCPSNTLPSRLFGWWDGDSRCWVRTTTLSRLPYRTLRRAARQGERTACVYGTPAAHTTHGYMPAIACHSPLYCFALPCFPSPCRRSLHTHPA